MFTKRLVLLSAFFFSTFMAIFAQVASKADSVSPILIGKSIPTTTLTTAEGKSITTNELLAGKQSILIFYRGGWCPYCNVHLKELQTIESQLIGLGYQILAVSPDEPKQLLNTFGKDSLKYQLFSDSHTDLIKKMGIAFKGPEKYGKMFSEYSGGGNSEGILPAPAVFIVDKNGKIIDDDAQRPSDKEIRGVLDGLLK